MSGDGTRGSTTRISSVGHAVFAVILIGLGVLGLVKGDFDSTWPQVPKTLPGREALAYLSALVYLGCGIGLLWRRTAAIASRLLLGYLLLWLLLASLPGVFLLHPTLLAAWEFGKVAMMVAAAWVLYVWLAGERDSPRFRFINHDHGLRIARVLCGLAVIPWGLAHFVYLEQTTVLVPGWMGSPSFWAYLTGAGFVAAGIAMLSGVWPRLAATLLVVQLAALTLLVWAPRAATGNLNAFQWGEVVSSVALTAAAWVVADSYRDEPWLGVPWAASPSRSAAPA